MKVTIEETTKDGKKKATVSEVKDVESTDDGIKRKPCPGPIVQPCPKLIDILGIVFGSRWCKNGRSE